MKRSRKRSPFDELFDLGPSLFDELEDMLSEGFTGGGYSISVTQVGGKTVVHAKLSDEMDAGSVRRELERQYPGAEIVIEGGKPTIEEVSPGSVAKNKKMGGEMHRVREKPTGSSLIEEIDRVEHEED